ncbi:MAG TPA: hypothetical protein VFG35_08900 [Actinoplanes sp.]|nr:hypothetical protein [Actinoplanes sp.]
MPTLKQLQASHAEYRAMVNSARRDYLVSDGKVMSLWFTSDGIGDEGVNAHVFLDSRFENTSPADFVKVAELKAMIDDWMSGKLPELPPSTAVLDDNHWTALLPRQ